MRITGGLWRSRQLVAPRGASTRPTSDRVREALFSMLASDGVTAPSRVLDLYAGSGALAFEALSRGALHAVAVEHARDAVAAIRDNARALDAGPRLEIVASRVAPALARLTRVEGGEAGRFDLVLLDPPYADVREAAFPEILAAAASILAEGGVLVLEHASTDAAPAVPGLTLDRSRRHGDTTLSLYARPASRPDAAPESPGEATGQGEI